MSEPRRFGLWKRFKEDSFMVCHGDYDMNQLGPCDTAIKVVEAEPILARIEQLETQLKEANEIIALQAIYTTHTYGKLAREYLKKWEGK